MNNPIISEGWRDIVSVGSLGLTAIGFLFTIFIGVKAKRAAVLAKEASQGVALDMKRLVHKHEVETAHRYLNEAKLYIHHQDWKPASIRLSDLATAFAQIALLDSDEWANIIEEARKWAVVCEKLSQVQLKSFQTNKWHAFVADLEGEIDRFRGPFQKAELDGES